MSVMAAMSEGVAPTEAQRLISRNLSKTELIKEFKISRKVVIKMMMVNQIQAKVKAFSPKRRLVDGDVAEAVRFSVAEVVIM
jgi:hypothetical protein